MSFEPERCPGVLEHPLFWKEFIGDMPLLSTLPYHLPPSINYSRWNFKSRIRDEKKKRKEKKKKKRYLENNMIMERRMCSFLVGRMLDGIV